MLDEQTLFILRAIHARPLRFMLLNPAVRFSRHSGQYFGQFRQFDGKVKVLPHFRHFLVRISTGWYFALHSWQQSGQCWTFSGRVKVFPQILHVLVIIPISGVFGCLSFPANSFFNHSNIDLPFSSGILFQNSWQQRLSQYLFMMNQEGPSPLTYSLH